MKETVNEEKATAETIKLDQFLKLAQVVESGGQAKHLIQTGMVFVNGVIEMRHGRKLRAGDVVVVEGEELVVDRIAKRRRLHGTACCLSAPCCNLRSYPGCYRWA